MRHTRRSTPPAEVWVVAIAVAALAALAALAVVPDAFARPHMRTSVLTGANEPNDSGDPDASATLTITLDRDAMKLCYAFTDVTNIGAITGAHIHRGGDGEAGPVVLTLMASGRSHLKGCVPVSRGLMDELWFSPGRFYAQIHTAEYPNGAIRGRLSH